MSGFRPWFIIRNAVTVMLMKLNVGDTITQGHLDLMYEFTESYDRKSALIDSYIAECNKDYEEKKSLKAKYLALTVDYGDMNNAMDDLQSELSEAYDIIANKDADIESLHVQLESFKAKFAKTEKAYIKEVESADELYGTAEMLKSVITIKAMNINIPELFKVFTEAGVQSACPLVECCVEEYPTEDVIAYNCHNRCKQPAENCCYCTFYR